MISNGKALVRNQILVYSFKISSEHKVFLTVNSQNNSFRHLIEHLKSLERYKEKINVYFRSSGLVAEVT